LSSWHSFIIEIIAYQRVSMSARSGFRLRLSAWRLSRLVSQAHAKAEMLTSLRSRRAEVLTC
jgi:hypothetical protein